MDIKIYQKKARCDKGWGIYLKVINPGLLHIKLYLSNGRCQGGDPGVKMYRITQGGAKNKIGHKRPNIDFQIRSKVKSIIEMTSFISHNVKESDYNFYYD